MSVSITQQPTSGAVYARNTVPKIILEADESVSVALIFKHPMDEDWEPDNIVFEGTYIPDLNGQITLDFEGLYEPYIQTQFPFVGSAKFQDKYWCSFNAVMTGIDSETSCNVVYRVANALLNSSTPFASWADQNFLTNQPLEKPTTKGSSECLTFFDATEGARVLKVRFYPKAGGTEDITVFTEDIDTFNDAQALCNTVDVSYSRLVKMSTYLASQLKGYYDLILFNSKGSEICRQRYIYEECTGKEKHFLFVNALGGIDMLVCHGENTLQPELTLNIGRVDGKYIALDDTENARSWNQMTGNMPYRWRDWLYELMAVRQKAWKYQDGDCLPIVLKTAEIAMGDGEQLAVASFSYMMENVNRAISDTERAMERTLHQSVAEEAEELDDLTTTAVLAFVEDQQESFETEAIEIPASRVYVTAYGNGTIYYTINGTLEGNFNPSTDRMPVVIDLDPGDEIQFFSQDIVAESLTANYYPDEAYLATQTASAQQQTES